MPLQRRGKVQLTAPSPLPPHHSRPCRARAKRSPPPPSCFIIHASESQPFLFTNPNLVQQVSTHNPNLVHRVTSHVHNPCVSKSVPTIPFLCAGNSGCCSKHAICPYLQARQDMEEKNEKYHKLAKAYSSIWNPIPKKRTRACKRSTPEPVVSTSHKHDSQCIGHNMYYHIHIHHSQSCSATQYQQSKSSSPSHFPCS